MAEGSRYSSYFIKETESGVTPNTGTLKIFRATKSGLDINIATLQSDELRDDAEVADFRLGTRHVEGTATAEFSADTFDDLIAAAMRNVWSTNTVKGGIERQSFTFVDYNADIPDMPYTIYRGCEINTMAITVGASAMTQIEFGIVGRTMEPSATLPAGLTVGPRTLTPPMDGFSGSINLGATALSVITELTMNIDNGIEPRFVVGSKFSIKPGVKRRNVTGTLTSYYEDNTIRNKFLNEEESLLTIDVIDGTSGAGYRFKMPRMKITEAPRPVDGEGDIMINMSYRGLLSNTDGYSMQITKLTGMAFTTNLAATKAVTAGQALSLTVAVSGGSSPYTYVWKKNGVVVSGQSGPTFNKTGAAASDSGTYTCEVTDNTGRKIISSACAVTVS